MEWAEFLHRGFGWASLHDDTKKSAHAITFWKVSGHPNQFRWRSEDEFVVVVARVQPRSHVRAAHPKPPRSLHRLQHLLRHIRFCPLIIYLMRIIIIYINVIFCYFFICNFFMSPNSVVNPLRYSKNPGKHSPGFQTLSPNMKKKENTVRKGMRIIRCGLWLKLVAKYLR